MSAVGGADVVSLICKWILPLFVSSSLGLVWVQLFSPHSHTFLQRHPFPDLPAFCETMLVNFVF